MTLRSYTYCVPIASLHFATLYNPSRLCRQFGQKQLIVEPVHEFEPGPLSQNFVDNLIETWLRRTIMRQINYNGDLSTDDQYKEWIQLQQNERNDFLVFRRTRELQSSSTRRLQLPGPFIYQERISFILLQLNPFLVLIISGQVLIVINMPQNGSSRPSSSQVIHEVLRKRSRPELVNRSHN